MAGRPHAHAGDLARWGVRVAVDAAGEVLGFCATSPARPRWIVEHMWVRPGEIGRGVGRALVRDALDRAREGGAVGLEIESDPYAEGFYLRLGAKTVGAVPAPMPGAPDRTLPRLRLDAVDA